MLTVMYFILSTKTTKPAAAKTSKGPFSSIMDSEEDGDDLFASVKSSSTTKTQTVKTVEVCISVLCNHCTQPMHDCCIMVIALSSVG